MWKRLPILCPLTLSPSTTVLRLLITMEHLGRAPLCARTLCILSGGGNGQAKAGVKNKQPFKAVIEKDKSYFAKGGEKALLQLVAVTHTGITEDEFELSVKNFFTTAKYPRGNVPIKNITYQPQLELLNYLRDNNFKTFICTGGTIEFVRGISQELYGIPKTR